MASRFQIKIDEKGIGAMLKGKGVQAMLGRKVAAMKRSADAASGLDADARVWVGRDRARATLGLPMHVEARTGALSRSLDAAKDA